VRVDGPSIDPSQPFPVSIAPPSVLLLDILVGYLARLERAYPADDPDVVVSDECFERFS
jgi:hypothetical protein